VEKGWDRNPVRQILSTKKGKPFISFLIVLKVQIFSTVLKGGMSDPVGFHPFSPRFKYLWNWYENVIISIFIEDKIMLKN